MRFIRSMKEQTLYCRAGDPCKVKCTGKSSCSSGTKIKGGKATDLTVKCGASDACKSDIDITCGSGDCVLKCDTNTACEDWGDIDVSDARSFECIGDCPHKVPAPFTASPTRHPTPPTESPTPAPTPSPTPAPTPSPTPSPA